MAFSYKTPGAYIEEIVKLPPSVASVETAIPIFIGVTEIAPDIAEKELVGGARKITSMAEYEQFYGFPEKAMASVEVNLNLPSKGKLTQEYYNNMYFGVKHYFDNGGGPCFILSIGKYSRTGLTANTYKEAIFKLDLLDEVTIVVFPDLNGLKNKDQIYDVYNSALTKVAALQDKFVVVDLFIDKPTETIAVNATKTEFRSAITNNINTMKYGAAYFPPLFSTYNYDFTSANIIMKFGAEMPVFDCCVERSIARIRQQQDLDAPVALAGLAVSAIGVALVTRR